MISLYTSLTAAALCAALAAAPLAAQQADLSLQLTQADANPTRYTKYAVTVTLANAGPDAARDVSVALPLPEGLVYVGGQEFAASAGRFRPYSSQTWELPGLGAGDTATLTLNLFLLAPEAPDYYGEVLRAGVDDPDSAPGNGERGVPREDDEASVVLGPGDASGGPDLALGGLRVDSLAAAAVDTGVADVLFYAFDLANVGDADVDEEFAVVAYLSADTVLSGDDLRDGRVPTANFAAGFAVEGVVGASNVSALDPGAYYLILVADGDSVVAERDEVNNVAVAPFTVPGPGAGGRCAWSEAFATRSGQVRPETVGLTVLDDALRLVGRAGADQFVLDVAPDGGEAVVRTTPALREPRDLVSRPNGDYVLFESDASRLSVSLTDYTAGGEVLATTTSDLAQFLNTDLIAVTDIEAHAAGFTLAGVFREVGDLEARNFVAQVDESLVVTAAAEFRLDPDPSRPAFVRGDVAVDAAGNLYLDVGYPREGEAGILSVDGAGRRRWFAPRAPGADLDGAALDIGDGGAAVYATELRGGEVALARLDAASGEGSWSVSAPLASGAEARGTAAVPGGGVALALGNPADGTLLLARYDAAGGLAYAVDEPAGSGGPGADLHLAGALPNGGVVLVGTAGVGAVRVVRLTPAGGLRGECEAPARPLPRSRAPSGTPDDVARGGGEAAATVGVYPSVVGVGGVATLTVADVPAGRASQVLYLTDARGRRLRRVAVAAHGGVGTAELSVGNAAPGFYYVDGPGVEARRIVVR